MRGEGGDADAFAPTPEAVDKANPGDEGECDSVGRVDVFRGGLASGGGGPETGEELSSFAAAPIS